MKILIAVDDTEFSRVAVEDCLKKRWKDGTEFRIVYVVDFFEPLPALEEMKRQTIERARTAVKKFADEMQAAFPNMQSKGEVLDGYTTSEIVRAAKEWPADLIVMGSHGRSGLAQFFIGSVSREVLAHASCSVRIVRKVRDYKSDSNKVVVALDSSEYSQAALKSITATEWPEGTKFLCISVVPPLADYHYSKPSEQYLAAIEEEKKQMRTQAEAVLSKAVEELNTAFGADAARFQVLEDDPWEQIVKASEQEHADLIVLGAHGRDVERMLLGSVSEKVATHAKCSVQVVRLKEAVPAKV